MRISSLALFTAALALVQAGCNSSQTDTALPTAAASNAQTDSTPNATAAGATKPEDTATASATQSEVSASQTAKTDTKAEENKEPQHELIAGIKNPILSRQFESTHKGATENPTDPQAQIVYINVLQSVGQERMKAKETEKGYATFAAAGDVARRLLETKTEVPEEMHSLLGVAFYNDACAASRGKDAKKALQSLDEAVKWNFSDFDLLEKDEDLVSVRGSADFTKKLEGWKAAVREKMVKHAKQELASGESFPFDFALTDVDGKPIKLADYKGKILIVDIWGTWCPPCRAEIPSFVKLQDEYGKKGFQMVGLNKESQTGDEANQLIKKFMADQKMNYPCALIDKATQDQIKGFQGYPTTLFFDRSGKVRLTAVGLHEYGYLEAVIQVLLEEPAPGAEAAGGK